MGPRPSRDTALVLVVRLPPALEALRMRSIADARQGVPAHVTLLWPFAEEDALGPDVLGLVEAIVARHPRLDVTLGEGRRFPDTLYASVEPDGLVRALQADLAAAFPTLPLYEGEFPFTPHVSVVEGAAALGSGPVDDPAWGELPVTQRVDAVDLITTRAGQWATRRRFPLGARAG
ncbi:MAG TPA: 2'-5' RNA ligase family protein [Candidatus Limnocylindrales bacterium]|nr:2'-5' RNA ligase family protein [Candidatus Limnocylindrales bacterium]